MAEPVAPKTFVEILLPAMGQAAAIARALEGRVWNQPKDGEDRAAKAALTIADSATQEALLVPLLAAFPDLRLEAEEDTPSAARFSGRGPARVVVDPIDGTLHSYLEGRGPYAVMTGLALEDRYEAALVALPREGLLLEAVRRGGARRWPSFQGPPEPVRLAGGGSRVLVSHEMPRAVLRRLADRGLEPQPACGGAIAVAPLLPGVRGGLRLATGGGSISVRGRIGLLIAREAGARACGESGRPFPADLDSAARALAVAGDDDTLELLLRALGDAV